jgi:hypothetical protein
MLIAGIAAGCDLQVDDHHYKKYRNGGKLLRFILNESLFLGQIYGPEK